MNHPDLDEHQVRSLLSDQHPDLAGLQLSLVEGGWDNQMWRLGDDLAVRIPRTERAPRLLRHEHRWLSTLAPLLPLPVPTPIRLGTPSERFPRTWIITTWVEGEAADREPIRGPHSTEVLAGFLKALHRAAPPEAPINAGRGGNLAQHGEDIDAFLRSDLARPFDTTGLKALWSDAVEAPEWDGARVWLHGDLHPANILVSGGDLAGVIDFGDMCSGDPATDLAAAWVLLPDDEAQRCLAAYGGVDEATVRRARGWALVKCVGLLKVGHAGDMGWTGGKPTWGPAGRAALHRLLAQERDG